MGKVFLPIMVALAVFLSQCASTKQPMPGVYLNSQKLNGRSFHKLFVEVQTVDVQLRSQVEGYVVDALIAQGFAGVRSLDLIPFSIKELKLPTEEEIKLKVKESGSDGILLISVSRKGEKLEYTPGTVKNANEQMGAGLLASALYKYVSVDEIPPVNRQGSFAYTGADLIFLTQLYDVPATELMFSTTSGRIDPVSPAATGKNYAAGLVNLLFSEKLLGK